MNDEAPIIAEGELQALLDGEDLPHVAAALAASPALQAEFAALQQTQRRIAQLAQTAQPPDDYDLLDVAAGQASATQILLVGSYLQRSAEARERLAYLLEGEHPDVQQGAALILALPPPHLALMLSANPAAPAYPLTVPASDLQITLQVQELAPASYQLNLQLTHQGQPLAYERIVIQAATGYRASRITDAKGQGRFPSLPAGTYHLRIKLANALVVTPPLHIQAPTLSQPRALIPPVALPTQETLLYQYWQRQLAPAGAQFMAGAAQGDLAFLLPEQAEATTITLVRRSNQSTTNLLGQVRPLSPGLRQRPIRLYQAMLEPEPTVVLVAETLLDRAGRFRFADLPPGRYVLAVVIDDDILGATWLDLV
ncbi:MAG: carboxypeptidase-like regulatory domain-containing protein [Oscillochloridaceae bacterium umkhey_bin13]